MTSYVPLKMAKKLDKNLLDKGVVISVCSGYEDLQANARAIADAVDKKVRSIMEGENGII